MSLLIQIIEQVLHEQTAAFMREGDERVMRAPQPDVTRVTRRSASGDYRERNHQRVGISRVSRA
jgi:hypothetical protein